MGMGFFFFTRLHNYISNKQHCCTSLVGIQTAFKAAPAEDRGKA